MPSPRKRRLRRALAEVIGADTDLTDSPDQKTDAFVNNLAALSAYRSSAPTQSRPFTNGDKIAISSGLDDLLFGAGGEAGVSFAARAIISIEDNDHAKFSDAGGGQCKSYIIISNDAGTKNYAFVPVDGVTQVSEWTDAGEANQAIGNLPDDLLNDAQDALVTASDDCAGTFVVPIHKAIAVGLENAANSADGFITYLAIAIEAQKADLDIASAVKGSVVMAADGGQSFQVDLDTGDLLMTKSNTGRRGNSGIYYKFPDIDTTGDVRVNGVSAVFGGVGDATTATTAFQGGGTLAAAPSGERHARHFFDSRALITAGAPTHGNVGGIAAANVITDVEGVLYSQDGPYAQSVPSYDNVVSTAGQRGSMRINPTGWAAGKALQVHVVHDLSAVGNADTLSFYRYDDGASLTLQDGGDAMHAITGAGTALTHTFQFQADSADGIVVTFRRHAVSTIELKKGWAVRWEMVDLDATP